MISFTFQNAAAGVLSITAIAEYWRTRRGPLVLASIALTHARAVCLCLRWEIGKVPARWRQQYPAAVNQVG